MTEIPSRTAPALIHFYGPLTVAVDDSPNRVMSWGSELVVSEAVRERSKDRFGKSWLDIIDDEPAQIRCWGRVMVGSGPWPSHLPKHQPGSIEASDAYETARMAAWKLPTEYARAEEFDRIRDQFGAAPVTSKTIETSENRAK